MTPFECKYQIVPIILLVFVDAYEDSIMADDVTMPSNLPIALVEKEELEKTSFDVNVSQWSCDEKSSKKGVRTQVNHSAWDH